MDKIKFINEENNTSCTIIPKITNNGYFITERQVKRIRYITKGNYQTVLINNRLVNLCVDDTGSGDFYAYEVER